MTARDVRPGNRAIFSIFGAISLLNYTVVNLEKREKNVHWRKKFKISSGDGAPKLQISVPCRGRTCTEHFV